MPVTGVPQLTGGATDEPTDGEMPRQRPTNAEVVIEVAALKAGVSIGLVVGIRL